MKRNFVLVSVLLLAVIYLTTGCGAEQQSVATEITFDELFSSPEKYDGKHVVLEGFYFGGFEIIVLSEKLVHSGYAEGHLIPSGKMIWVEGGIPKEVHDRLYQQHMIGPTERFGKVRLEGEFEYGAKYGHLGGYSYQITPSEVALLPWSPPGE